MNNTRSKTIIKKLLKPYIKLCKNTIKKDGILELSDSPAAKTHSPNARGPGSSLVWKLDRTCSN